VGKVHGRLPLVTLHDEHPRLARLIERGARRTLAAVSPPPPLPEPEPPPAPEPPPPPPPEPGAAERFARAIGSPWLAAEGSLATRRLYERLDEEDVAKIELLISETPELAAYYELAGNQLAREQMVLAYGIWLEHPPSTAKTGLLAAQPPEEVHLMARGPLASAGGLYEADFIVDALAGVNVDMAGVSTALDFGCSSGRVVRVLAAAYPEIEWHGCDPNAPAIAWASEKLPAIEFFVNDNAPPLPLSDGSLDLAYAISIWSHFAPNLGLRWFEEMHRLIRPGGHLLCTTHGLTSVAHSAAHGRSEEQVEEILDSLYRQGSWYAPEFGEEGDWGVVNPDWGTAFLSPEWLLTHLCPRWRVLEFAPGRNQENQDVYVLQRV
jgi:SAM-dependent methyltransferase